MLLVNLHETYRVLKGGVCWGEDVGVWRCGCVSVAGCACAGIWVNIGVCVGGGCAHVGVEGVALRWELRDVRPPPAVAGALRWHSTFLGPGPAATTLPWRLGALEEQPLPSTLPKSSHGQCPCI